ncbi:MAG TPA: hypothetical protein VLV83_16010 [Acidobacteriota bacterium]|nr:hypothetical protein [Acidobacteriota bacterium]
MPENIRSNERGVSTSEYAVMLALVALAVSSFGLDISGAVIGVFDSLMAILS